MVSLATLDIDRLTRAAGRCSLARLTLALSVPAPY